MPDEKTKLIAQNKKAFHDYFIEKKYEAGIELFGTEVKSLRQGKVNLKDSYATVDNGEIFITGMHISPYEKGNIFNVEPLRKRKLLMHKNEILYLLGAVKEKGYSLIPTKIYFKRSLAKIEIGLAKGKKLYDKREDAARKDAERDMGRAIREKIKTF